MVTAELRAEQATSAGALENMNNEYELIAVATLYIVPHLDNACYMFCSRLHARARSHSWHGCTHLWLPRIFEHKQQQKNQAQSRRRAQGACCNPDSTAAWLCSRLLAAGWDAVHPYLAVPLQCSTALSTRKKTGACKSPALSPEARAGVAARRITLGMQTLDVTLEMQQWELSSAASAAHGDVHCQLIQVLSYTHTQSRS